MNRKVKLGDLCDFINGGAWSDKEYVIAGIPVLKVSNFKPSGFLLEDVSRLPNSSLEKYKKNLLQKGDMVIATVGSHPNLINSAAGRSCVVTDEVTGYLLNQNAVCVKTFDSEVLDQRYLTYLGKSFYFQHYIQSRGKGAANQMRIAISAIKEYEFDLPDIETQQRIADILSAYDDLVENNQKQIKLLEEAAMQLYKEWFVNLRFSGYETTKIVDGLPDGWDLATVKDMGQVITGKTPSTAVAENYGKDIPFVKIPDMHGVIYPLKTEVKLSNRGASTQKNKFLPTKSIMVSCIATVGLVCIAHEACQTNQQINSIILNDEDNLYYMFFKMKGIKSLLEGVGSNGATMTNVNKTKFENIELLKPENEILKKFTELVEPFFNNILTLSNQNKKLKESRDKLLPKLMNGEIEV